MGGIPMELLEPSNNARGSGLKERNVTHAEFLTSLKGDIVKSRQLRVVYCWKQVMKYMIAKGSKDEGQPPRPSLESVGKLSVTRCFNLNNPKVIATSRVALMPEMGLVVGASNTCHVQETRRANNAHQQPQPQGIARRAQTQQRSRARALETTKR